MALVAPAGVYRTWVRGLADHADLGLLEILHIFVWDAKQQSTARGRRHFEHFMRQEGPRFLAMNIEAISAVKQARQDLADFVRSRKCFVAVDESTIIKNIDAKRTEYMLWLRRFAHYRAILCGLPTPRSPLDLFGQFAFLDPNILGFNNYTDFENRYAEIYRICMLPQAALIERLKAFAVNGKVTIAGIGKVEPRMLSREHIILELTARGVYVPTIPQVKGYRHEEELAAKIAPYSFRAVLADCYGLPPKIYMRREVELTEEQSRIYEELKSFATSELENEEFVTATHVIVRILRLHQILCGHTKDENGNVHTFPENRTKEVLSILSEFDGKAVIWCSYDEDIRKVAAAIEKEYGAGSVARFWGGNRDTREEEERMFKEQANCRFMLATQSAGGKGRTWSNADLLIYYSSTNNLEHRMQSEERADEVGKEQHIACVDIVAPGTVDEKILYALREKMDMAARITGDNWKEWIV